MPIASLSSTEAAQKLRKNPRGLWPDGRRRGQRLEGIVDVGCQPSFSFSTDDKIMTIGSCFAREVESALARLGFSLPALELEIPYEERVSEIPNDILNKYTIQSMANEIEWAFSPPAVPDTDLFVTAGDDLWHDPHLVHNLKPASLERVGKRRKAVLRTMRHLPQCRIVVVTLGLAEAWFDGKLQIYLNSMPPQAALNAEPDRFRLDVLSYDDIFSGIERFLDLLKRHGHPEHRVLMTVSPVPFKATFGGQDAIAANSYSKAVQRAAVEAAVRLHPHVDYFPSYEIVTLTDRKIAFKSDNIHVNQDLIAEIMRRAVSAYVPGQDVPAANSVTQADPARADLSLPGVLGRGYSASERGDLAGTAAEFAGMLFRFEKQLTSVQRGGAFAALIRALVIAGRIDEAYRHCRRWLQLDPANPTALGTMSKVFEKKKDPKRAIELATRASRMQPDDPAAIMRLAALLMRSGRPDEARKAARRALALDPSLVAAREMLRSDEAAGAVAAPAHGASTARDRLQRVAMGIRRVLGMRKDVFLALLFFQLFVVGGCRAQPVTSDKDVAAFAPAQVRTLRSLGAAGDGRTDDLAALNRAFRKPGNVCLDGEGASYRVAGTIEVSRDFCLRNATLVQSLPPVDTSPYIRRSCPVTQNPAAVADCGDPLIPREQLDRLGRALSVRTLLIRPPSGSAPIRVTLDRVKVDRGRFAQSGSRTDSAGIWLEGAARVDFRNVEITGDGKGYGLLLIRSRNVTLSNLYIHDMVWAPYPGDPRLTQARVAAIGWNSVPIHEFRAAGQDGVRAGKFYGVRVQEQISCAFLSEVHQVRIENGRIERCMARFDTGDLPWQADGLDIGQSSSDITIDNLTVDSTWEGVDVVANGNGIEGLAVNDLTVTNSFAFGLKFGYQLHGAEVNRLKVRGAGLAGVSLHGPIRNVAIKGAHISGIGKVHGSRGTNVAPWPGSERAGVRVDAGADSGGRPDDVVIADTNVTREDAASAYAFGLLNTAGGNVRTVRFRPSGFSKAAVGGRQ